MSKRNRIKVESPEGNALKKLREIRGVSLRKLAVLMKVSPTLIHHYEIGRADVSNEYLQKYLKALGFSRKDFDKILEGTPSDEEKRAKCICLVKDLAPTQVDFVLKMLLSL